MPEICVRLATQGDVPFIASLRGGVPLEPVVAAYLAGDYFPSHALRKRVVFLASMQAQPVGYVAGHLTTRMGCDGELQWLNVAENFRGLGVGDRLTVAILEWFKGQGCRKVCVNVASENIPARTVYGRNGAIGFDEHWMVWSDLAKS